MRLETCKTRLRLLLALVLLDLAVNGPVSAQQPAPPRAVTAGDYARAEKFMGYNTEPLVDHAVQPAWTSDGRLWYRDTDAQGVRFVVFDPLKLTKDPAFDHVRLAAALSQAAGRTIDANKLPFREIEFTADGQSVSFRLGRRRFRCDRQGSQCTAEGNAEGPPGRMGRRGRAGNEVPSPDKKRVAFIRDYNLWVREISSGKETQLTTDGVKDFSYALDNAGWEKSDRPILLWSPDSRKLATFQQDQRNVGDMYLVETKVGHPALQSWKYPLPGDDSIATIQRVVIDVERRR